MGRGDVKALRLSQRLQIFVVASLHEELRRFSAEHARAFGEQLGAHAAPRCAASSFSEYAISTAANVSRALRYLQ